MEILIITIPLISSIIILTLGRFIGHKGGRIISIGSIITSTIISIKGLLDNLEGKTISLLIKDWFDIGETKGKIEILIDKESIVMINLISIITMVVIIYSYYYLVDDAHLNRFVSKLLIFAVSMYIFVASNNLLFSFLGWEGVGIVSFLLINFWSTRSTLNSKCAIKAVIFNRIGDIGYIVGIIAITIIYNSYSYSYINSLVYNNNNINIYILSIISISFIIAAMAKSAQIFLHPWLGDAMAGPTPVSALLHAATMVTAGVFIVIRTKGLILESLPLIRNLLLLVGSLTIIFAGLSALCQYDIKKIIAYSTCGQIGYMFYALGLYKPLDGSLYHLVTHGFFKALLFLSAGILINTFLHEQDLRRFGLYIYYSPLFYSFFLIGSLAIIAYPALAGYYSKELILIHSLAYPIHYYIVLYIGSILSSLYSIKLLYLAFFNSPVSLSSFTLSFSPLSYYSYFYILPIGVLIIGSIFLGFITMNYFSSLESIDLSIEYYLYLNPIIKLLPNIIPILAILIMIIYKYNLPNILFTKYNYLFYTIFSRKFFFDSFYNYYLVRPLFSSSYFLFYKFIDRGYLEFFGPISLFRFSYLFPKSFSLYSQSISNTPYLFLFFFLGLFFLILPSLALSLFTF